MATTSGSRRLATGKLRCFRVRYLVVQFQPLKRRGLCRIEPELLGLLAEEIALFGIIVEAVHFHFLAPAFDFFRRFLFAVAVEPFNDFLIARTLLDLRFEVVPFYAFEPKEHVIKRTVKMIFADVASHERATFVDRTSKNRVAANPNAGTARRFPR